MGSKKNKSKVAAVAAAGGGGDSAGKGKKKAKEDPRFSKKVIEDPRFSKMHNDPRFQNVPKKQAKVTVDSRFSGMLTDKKFSTGSSARVDKRGRVRNQSENDLGRYYHFDDDDDEVKKTKKKNTKKLPKKKVEEEEEEDKSGGESSEEFSEPESGSESSSTTSTDDTDDDDADISGDEASVEVENVPIIDKETHRLAVVNMDWSQVKAVDLFVMLSSCLPKGGQIKSVAVYPSEFGLQRMEEEAVRGPVALFEDDKEKEKGDSDEDDDEDGESDEDGDDDDDEDEDSDNPVSLSKDVSGKVKGDRNKDVVDDEDEDEDSEFGDFDSDIGDEDDVEEDDGDEDDFDDEDEDDDEIDTEKLRAYEKSKLRYYYAVVECDSVATADHLYKTCDGMEFERSSNVLDLRFIPDSREFKHPPRQGDVATEMPAVYEGLDFHTRALQQSNAVLSWDDDEPHRAKTLRRNFSEKQLAEMELNEFLASDESESDEDENGDQDPSEKKKKKADMYRALIQSGDGSEEDDEGQNMEVTFATGLEDISKKIIEKKERGSETVFEAYLRKKKEKKDAAKNKSKNSSDDDSDETDQEPIEDQDDFFEDSPSVERKKKKGKGKKKVEKEVLEDKVAEASRAELELLLADEDGANKKVKGYNIKKKKAKSEKGEEAPDETNLPTVDVDDTRFSDLFNNPRFALDPTDPQFKRSATYYRQLTQREKKKGPEECEGGAPVEVDKQSADTFENDKLKISTMIKSLRMKSQQHPMSSSVKMKNTMRSNGSTSGKKHKLQGTDRATKKAKLQK